MNVEVGGGANALDALEVGGDGARVAKLLKSPKGVGVGEGDGLDSVEAESTLDPPVKPKSSATEELRDGGPSVDVLGCEFAATGFKEGLLLDNDDRSSNILLGRDCVAAMGCCRPNMLLMPVDCVGDKGEGVDGFVGCRDGIIAAPAKGLLVRGTGLLLPGGDASRGPGLLAFGGGTCGTGPEPGAFDDDGARRSSQLNADVEDDDV